MAQSSILGRIGQLIRANVNAILDSAEDPERMLEQRARDSPDNIAEAGEAAGQTIGNLRLVEDDAREAREAVTEWGGKAAAASRRADELRAAGNAREADRFDELAKIALRRQISYEGQAKTLETQAAQQTVLADKLKDGLNKLRDKRDELVARAKMAQAQAQVQKTMKSVSVMDPTSELARFEEGIRRQEAQVRGMEEVSAASVEEQFASLESDEGELEVDARLATLKGGG